MVTGPGWAKGSNQYAKRIGAPRQIPDPAVVPPGRQLSGRTPALDEAILRQVQGCGITWEPFDAGLIQPSDTERARFRFRSQLPELIWNTAALEGNTFTLPEVRTLLDGVTVGGKRLADEQQIIALSEAYNRLDGLVGAGEFTLAKHISDELHTLVARHEAIECGHFRGEGKATGGGAVMLSNGGAVGGIPHGPNGIHLRRDHRRLLGYLEGVEDARVRALLYFASATRRQYYVDGNKRTSRLMMAGELMSHGYDAVNIPFARKLEFNVAVDTMFSTDNATDLLAFLGTCAISD